MYYHICTVKHVRIKIIHGSQNMSGSLTWVRRTTMSGALTWVGRTNMSGALTWVGRTLLEL